VPAARRAAPCLALSRSAPPRARSFDHDRGVTTLAVPLLGFAASHFLALRSGFIYLRAPASFTYAREAKGAHGRERGLVERCSAGLGDLHVAHGAVALDDDHQHDGRLRAFRALGGRVGDLGRLEELWRRNLAALRAGRDDEQERQGE